MLKEGMHKKTKRMKTYMVEFHYASNTKKIIKSILENGAHFVTITKIPFWNLYGQILHEDYLIIYQHTHELEFEILT